VDFERSQLVKTGLRAVLGAGILVAIYYLAPIPHRAHESIVPRVGVALVLFAVVLTFEVRQIIKNDHPMLRATVAMATIIPLFIVSFAWIYLTLSRSDPATFGMLLSRTSALYFTVTVFSTVGFGDITVKTDPARIVVAIQMLTDLVVLAVVVRLILGAATRGQALKESQPAD